MEKNIIDGLNCYGKQINTKKYNDYMITDHFWGDDYTFKRSGDTIVTCERTFQAQHPEIIFFDSFVYIYQLQISS